MFFCKCEENVTFTKNGTEGLTEEGFIYLMGAYARHRNYEKCWQLLRTCEYGYDLNLHKLSIPNV